MSSKYLSCLEFIIIEEIRGCCQHRKNTDRIDMSAQEFRGVPIESTHQ